MKLQHVKTGNIFEVLEMGTDWVTLKCVESTTDTVNVGDLRKTKRERIAFDFNKR